MSAVESLVMQSSKEGIDEHGMDYDMLYVRSQFVKSDQLPHTVGITYDMINYAKTCEPRLRMFLLPDSKTKKYKIASFSSINGKILKMVQTQRQEHNVTQQNVQNRKGWEGMFKGKEQQAKG